MQFVTAAGVLSLAVFLVWAIVSLIRLIAGADVGIGTGLGLLMLLIGGVCMLALGVIGFYIGRIYDEIKRRPRYIIAAVCGMKEEK